MTSTIDSNDRHRGSAISDRTAPQGAGSLPQRIEMIRRAMTASEIAEFLAISPITVYKMAKAGRLPSFRVGTAVRFDPRIIAEWLRGNTM
jgi:excisionase family DNA binding protein